MLRTLSALSLTALVGLATAPRPATAGDVPKPRSGASRWNVAVMVYDRMEILDFAGPRRDFPKIKVLEDRRVVDNGKVLTAAGVSAGIDGSLYVVAKMCGMEAAKQTAHYMEYRWQPDATPKSDASDVEHAARVAWF